MIDPNFREIKLSYQTRGEDTLGSVKKLRLVYRPVWDGYCYTVAINNTILSNHDTFEEADTAYLKKLKTWNKAG